MLGYALLLVVEILAVAVAIYTIYKVIWYTVNLLRLKIKLNRLNSKGVIVSFKRGFLNIVFGKKGIPDFTVTTPTEVYRVSVISSISTHGRWNVEKTKEHFYLDVRRKSKLFYKVEHHSGSVPAHALEFRRETRFYRRKLFLETKNTSNEKAVLLFFPRPKTLTFSETKMDYMYAGYKVCDYEVMFEPDFFELFSNKK